MLIKWQCQDVCNTCTYAQLDSIAGTSVKSGQKCLLTAVLPWRALEAQLWSQINAFIPEKECSMRCGYKTERTHLILLTLMFGLLLCISGCEHLLCKHEDLSLSLQHPHKQPGISACTFSEVRGRKRKIRWWSYHWARLTDKANWGLNDRLCLREKLDSDRARHSTSSSGLWMQALIYPDAFNCTLMWIQHIIYTQMCHTPTINTHTHP